MLLWTKTIHKRSPIDFCVINILYCISLKLQTIYIIASPSLFFNLTVKKSLYARSRLNFEDQNKGYISYKEFGSISHKMFNVGTNIIMICWDPHHHLIVWDQLSKLLSGVFNLYYFRWERSHHQQQQTPTCFLQSFWVFI